MACRASSSTPARALFNIFTNPSPSTLIRPTAIHPRRLINTHKPAIKSKIPDPFNDENHPLDRKIGARTVHYVDDAGTFHRSMALHKLIAEVDGQMTHIRRMSVDRDGTPIVRKVSAKDMRDEFQAKLAAAAKKPVEEATKQLELSWGVDQNDLAHRLKRLDEFIKDGRRVEVLIAPKRGGRRVGPDVMKALLEQIYAAADEIQGLEEWKDMDGQLGRQVVLYFRLKPSVAAEAAKPTGVRAIKQSREEKMKRKEEEKRAWKEELEARARRREERDRERQNARPAAEESA